MTRGAPIRRPLQAGLLCPVAADEASLLPRGSRPPSPSVPLQPSHAALLAARPLRYEPAGEQVAAPYASRRPRDAEASPRVTTSITQEARMRLTINSDQIEPGEYRARLQEIKATDHSDYGKGLRFTFRVTDGPAAGTTL